MSMQTISGQSPVYGTHRHHPARHRDDAAIEATTSQSEGNQNQAASTRQCGHQAQGQQANGTFMRAVFTTFASFTSGNTKSDGDAAPADSEQNGAGFVRLKEKMSLDVHVQDDGGIECALQLKAKVKVQGDAAASSDVMQAMQAFASNLFSALRSLFDGVAGTPAASTGDTPASTPASGAAQSVQSIPATPAQSEQTTPVATAVTAAPAATAQVGDKPTAPAAAAPATNNVQWIGSYLSVDARLRILAQHAAKSEKSDKKDETSSDDASAAEPSTSASPATAADGTMPALHQQFSDLKQQLQSVENGGVPSLSDFLHALADEMASAPRVSFSFSLALRGSFVSTSA